MFSQNLPMREPSPPAGHAGSLRRLLGCLALVAALIPGLAAAQEMNGFDLKDSLIPVLQINFGGPEKDGIPSIDKPDFVMAGFAAFLRNDDQALTIRYERNGKRATVHGSDGQQLAAVVGYWFAWYAFNPATEVFRAGEASKPR